MSHSSRSASLVKRITSRCWPVLAPVIGVTLGAFVASVLSFGLFFPRRLVEAYGNGVIGCVVVCACHLGALAIPVLLLQTRKSGWGLLVLGVSLVLLAFESTVYRATGSAAGYYDYLNLANAAGAVSNAASEFGMDAVWSTFGVGSLLALPSVGAWFARRSSPLFLPVVSQREMAGPRRVISLCALVVIGGFCGAFYFRGQSATRGLAPAYGLPIALALNAADNALRKPVQEATQVPVNAPHARHILFVIDESVQFDVLDELWKKTPQSQVIGRPLRMLSYANSSAASNVMLRHGCDPRWPDRALSGESLLKKARAAGYRVLYYDNQSILQRRENYFGLREQTYLNEHRRPSPDDVQPDLSCLSDMLKNLEATAPPTLILMNKKGSHFNYQNNILPGQALPGEPVYYTSVRINTVQFLQRIVDSGLLAHTSLYYTSDHGEDWRQKVPHGTTDPETSHRPQWEVPAFVLCPNGRNRSADIPASHWLSHFHLAESLNNELGSDDPEVPALAQALDPAFALNGDHQALFVFPFASLGRVADRKTLSRVRGDSFAVRLGTRAPVQN